MNQYTDPSKVYKNFVKYGFKKEGSQLKPSTRQSRKWMVLDPSTGKWVHFGAIGYEDYTKHNDKIRRKKYRSRMGRFESAYKYSPGYLSLVLLW